MKEIAAPGIALCLDEEGVIESIVRDDLGLAADVAVGKSIFASFDSGSARKARLFLEHIQTRGAAFDWELNIPLLSGLKTLNFVGAKRANGSLILAASTFSDIFHFYEELVQLNNEQVTLLRQALKTHSLLTRNAMEESSSIYEDLSILNNELLNAQRELAKKNTQLESLIQQKNMFLGMAAHDLRNPLSAIHDLATFLNKELPALSSENDEMLQHITSSSKYMLRLVEDLLLVSQADAGTVTLDRRPTELTTLVHSQLRVARALAARKNLRLEVDTPPTLPLMNVDPERLTQVVDNLLGNAIKYSPQGKVIRLTLAALDDGAMLEIRDQGPGIPNEELDFLFTPFYRTRNRPTAGETSTGLGLTIANRLIKAHGGRIEVNSTPGEGSTFTVFLPCAVVTDPLLSSTCADPELQRPPLLGRTLLLAEDDSVVRLFVRVQLEEMGAEVVEAPNGEAALAAWEMARGLFDAVLLDVEMPLMNGIETATAIRSREKAAGHRVLLCACTAHVDENVHRDLLDAGMDQILLKPLQMDKLTALFSTGPSHGAPQRTNEG